VSCALFFVFFARFLKLTLLVWRAAANMDAAILDLGCGNGHVCELLLALGFTKYMCPPHALLYVKVYLPVST
jgi:SAM-dependent methyltransferase